MDIFIIYFLIFYISIVDSNETLCSDKYYAGSRSKTGMIKHDVDINDLCSKTPCITKCCPIDHVIGFRLKCVKKTVYTKKINEFNESSYKVHSWNHWSRSLTVTSKKISDFKIIYNEKFSNDNDSCFYQIDPSMTNIDYFLMEDGSVKINLPNRFMRYDTIKPLQFCVDLALDYKTRMINVFYRRPVEILTQNDTEVTITAIAMLVSCFFLLVVLLVYIVLPELHELSGMMFMALITSLGAAYFNKAYTLLTDTQTSTDAEAKCTALTASYYFALLSSFFWMNVTSYDIWWACRGYRKCKNINRRGIMNKFYWYCLYAFGVPLLMTIGAVMVDFQDVGPDIAKPYFTLCLCYSDATFLYLSVPIAILLVMNCVLFLMTAYNIWLTKKRVNANPDFRNTKQNENRYMVYVKLSLIMGVNFVLEMLDFIFEMPSWSILLANLYNLLIGVNIFFLFVFKKSILVKICRRFKIKNRFVENLQLSQDTKTENSRIISTKSNTSQKNKSREESAIALQNTS